MWTRLLFVLLVAAASAQAWNPGTGYAYKVQSRTLSALHQVGDQYSGMIMRATLKLHAQSASKLYAKVSKPEYTNVHQALPGGWGSPIPDQDLQWQRLEMSEKPFIIQLRNGVIDGLDVDPNTPEWELNMIKGIVSQLQVDGSAENYFNSRINDLPSENSPNAVYKTMEDSVTGKCEVLYDISPLPEYELQSKPQLAPQPNPNPEEAQTLDIVKTTNYSHCEKRPVYHQGFSAENDLEPASTKMGQFFSRSSVSRVVVTGRPNKHLIQSAVTTNKVILSPAVYNSQKGMVVSRMNLTLLSVNADEAKQGWEETQQATLRIKDLVYDLTHPKNQQNQQNQERNSEESNQQSNEQEQQYESSEQGKRMQGNAAQRFRRSLKPAQQQQQQQQQQQKQRQQDNQQEQNQDSLASFESASFEDSSISSEKWHQRKPDMDQAPQIPFLGFFIGQKGESIQKKIDAVEKTAEIAREIAEDLQNPQSVPEKATLTKFSILIRLAQTMSTEQLQKATQKMQHNSEENTKEAKAWKVFRDAVNQAGTSPSLVIMKQWIDSKKVQGEEAAEMLAQLPNKALTPTKEYVHLFFKLATSEVVKSQRHLNTSAILSFSNLVRNAQVDRRSAHNRYPTHTFGRMNPTQAPAVTRDYIPYLAQQLRKAVREGNSVNIQTYVRALGNVAHPKILSVLEPYLEGEKQVSDFQRLHMVVALNQLVKVQPSLARAVLYRIYKNASETPEVRSAAVYLLMKTNPPASMLQRMAESTNFDNSKQVRSAVKSALESAAALRGQESQQLAENAQAAVNALNATAFGPEYSMIKLSSGKVPEMNIAFRAGLNSIGSEDSLAPNAVFAHVRQILAGLHQEADSAGYMASSTKDLVNLIAAQYEKDFAQPENRDIEREEAQQIEGNMFVKTQNGERFYAFDNHTVERIPADVKDMFKKLSKGESFNLQKMYTRESLTLAFPTATGLPFVYSLMTPTVASVQGKAQAEIKPEISEKWESAKATADVKILYSSKTEARIGFITPFDGKHHMAGTEKDTQINLPIRAELEINTPAENSQNEHQKHTVRVKVQPLKPEQDTQVAVLRSRAYTAQQTIAELKPAQKKTVHVNKPQKRTVVIGKESTGMAFRAEATTEQDIFDYAQVLRQLQKYDARSALAAITEEKEIKNYEYTITFDHEKSRAKSVLLSAAFERMEKQNENEQQNQHDNERANRSSNDDNEEKDAFEENLAIPSNTKPQSAERMQQLLNRIAKAMKNHRAAAIDVSAQFKGEREAVYMATVAAARSPMKDRLGALVYMRKASANGQQQEIAAFPTVQIPYAPLANYEQAIKNKPTAQAEAKISFGEDLKQQHSQVHIKANLERSEEREQYVREQPMSQLAKQQQAQGNNFLPAGQNATLEAGHMDKYEFDVKYTRIPASVQNATYKAYSLARHFGWEYNTEDLLSANNAPRKINLKVRFAPNLQSANVSIHAPQMNAEFKNIRLSRAVSAAIVAHPNYHPAQLVSRHILGKDYKPTCSIGKKALNTFDNKTFTLGQDEEWQLVAQYVPKKYEQTKHNPAKQVPYMSVQTRQNANNQKQVKIHLGNQDVVEIIPRGEKQHPEIKFNNQQVNVNSEKPTEVKSQNDKRITVRVEALPEGTVKVSAPQQGLEIIHDNTNVALRVGNQYRGDIRGLCGNFDGESETDFTAPKNCIMRDAQLFAKSYSVSEQGQIKHKQPSNEPRACIYKKTNRGGAVSDSESGRQGSTRAQQQYLKSAKGNQAQRCTNFRTKVVEQEGQLCFSLRPLPTCSAQCQPSGHQEKNVAFHCVEDSAASRHWAKIAQRGVSLDVASKGSNKNLTVKVPESCQA